MSRPKFLYRDQYDKVSILEIASFCDKKITTAEARNAVKLLNSGLGLYALTRSTQPCIPPGSLNRVPASAGVTAGMLPLPGGR